jgi:outer membrane murein-binding lipoprotein Lpp
MKALFNLRGLFLSAVAGFTLIFSGCSSSQKFVELSPSDISNLISEQAFVFVANKMNPLRGPQRFLYNYYDVKVDSSGLSTFLPYFGRVYSGYVDPIDGPLNFSTGKYTYSAKKDKKNSFQVTIKPTGPIGNSQVQSLNFDIFNNGTAALSIIGLNLDPISYYGYIQPVEAHDVAISK